MYLGRLVDSMRPIETSSFISHTISGDITLLLAGHVTRAFKFLPAEFVISANCTDIFLMAVIIYIYNNGMHIVGSWITEYFTFIDNVRIIWQKISIFYFFGLDK